MTLLAPVALWLGALAAVPLALHLWQRRRARRVVFPAVRYLRRMVRDHAREVRVQNLLLLLIRLGIVVAVALAAARPLASVPGVGHPPTALALVLDNSLSSQAVAMEGPVLERLKQSAVAIVDAAGGEDRLWLVTMDGVVVGGDAATVRSALEGIQPLDGAGDGPGALRRASAAVREATLPVRQVILLTEGQRSSWVGSADGVPAREAEVRRQLVVPVMTRRPNHAVVEAVGVPTVWGEVGALRFRTLGADSVPWRVIHEGRTFARGTAVGGATVIARGRPLSMGWGAVSVELVPDELRGDDRRHLAVRVGGPPPVTVDPSSGPYIARAVETLVAAGRVARGGEVGAMIGVGARRDRPSLILPPADPLGLPDLNRALERAGIPWRYEAPREAETQVTLPDPSGEVPRREAERPPSERVTVRRWYPIVPAVRAATVRPDAAVDTLVRIGAAPWVLRGDGYLLVASPLVPEATDLPVRAAFVPWLATLLTNHLARGEAGAREVVPGASIVVPRGVDGLEGTEGGLTPVVAGATREAPWRTGVYFWRRGAARVGALVVNPEVAESDTTVLDARTLAAALDADPLPADPATLPAALFATAGARPLDRVLLLLALLLLGLEALVARRGPRPSSDPVLA